MKIERADRLLPSEIAACDFSFDVTCEAVPPFDGEAVEQVVAVTPYRKSYEFDQRRFADCGETQDRLLAVASGDQVCGYVLASVAWNNCVLIEDLAVDRSVRRSGIGSLLMDIAAEWTKELGLPTIRLETQSNNVPACRFYQRYGFKLGGFDRYLYSALDLQRHETALYWYLFVGDEKGG